jgi:hypothetical protein
LTDYYLGFNGTNSLADCGTDASITNIWTYQCTTLDFWVSFNDSAKGEYTIHKGDPWFIEYWPAGGCINAEIYATVGAALSRVPVGPSWFDVWHHIAMVYDDNGDQLIYLAFDGVWQAYSVQNPPTVGPPLPDTGCHLQFGGFPASGLYTGCDIAWVRISQGARWTPGVSFSPPERCAAPRADGTTTELWRLNEGAGAVSAAEVNSPANDGTLANCSWELCLVPTGTAALRAAVEIPLCAPGLVQASYEVWLLHPATGVQMALLDHQEGLEYARRTNEVGSFTLMLPDTFDQAMAQKDARLIVWRQPSGGRKSIDFAGLVRYWVYQYVSGVLRRGLAGPCYNDILDTRIIPYNSGTGYTLKNQEADDLMKALVRENLGASATDGDRDLVTPGYLAVDGDTSLATVVWKQCCRLKLLQTLQEVAEASKETAATAAYFGVVPSGSGFDMIFRTNIGQWGQDHRYPDGPAGARIFAVERSNITDPKLEIDAREEVTYVYAAGQGEEDNRIILPVYDIARIGESPLNRREMLLDERGEDYISRLGSAGRTALEDGRPATRFTGSIVETPTSRYGIDWGFGDYVTASFLGQQYDVQVSMVNVKLSGQEETIRTELEYVG